MVADISRAILLASANNSVYQPGNPRPNGDNSTRRTIPNIDLNPGDILRVEGSPDGQDPAALDYIESCPLCRRVGNTGLGTLTQAARPPEVFSRRGPIHDHLVFITVVAAMRHSPTVDGRFIP
jgi:hypothetical protein